jgi:hypothetical protein
MIDRDNSGFITLPEAIASSYVFLQTFQKEADEPSSAVPSQQGPVSHSWLLPSNIKPSSRKSASGQDANTASQKSGGPESKIYRNQGLQNSAQNAAPGGATYLQSPQERLSQLSSSRNANVQQQQQQQQQQALILPQRTSSQDRISQVLSLRKENSQTQLKQQQQQQQQQQVSSEQQNNADVRSVTQNKAQARSAQERLSQVQSSRDAQSQQAPPISSLKGQVALRSKSPDQQSTSSRASTASEAQSQQSALAQLAYAANQARRNEAA